MGVESLKDILQVGRGISSQGKKNKSRKPIK